MRVEASSCLPLGATCLLLVLVGCGSGNLGGIVRDVGGKYSAGIDGNATTDAGRASAAVGQGACGDGLLQTSRGEQCDGSDLGGLSCSRLGLGTGTLTCHPMTCRVVTSQCTRDAGGVSDAGSVLDASGSGGIGAAGGSAGAGTNAGSGAGGRAGAGGTCPTGFTCGVPLGQGPQTVCIQWGEATGPVCLTPGPGVDCALPLAGSTCTDTGVGLYCLLPCAR